jgi:hypothetical protein
MSYVQSRKNKYFLKMKEEKEKQGEESAARICKREGICKLKVT